MVEAAWQVGIGRVIAPSLPLPRGATLVMNVVCQPLRAAVCLLILLVMSMPATGQFIDPTVQAVDQNTRAAISQYVNPAMVALVQGDKDEITKARNTLTRPFKDPSATAVFKDAYSEIITARMDKAVNHEDQLIRLNAMIVLSHMTNQASKALIDSGLEDDSPAVQRWAMEALGNRVTLWLEDAAGNDAQIKAAIDQVASKLNEAPAIHAIVVGPALGVLVEAGTDAAFAALIDSLNNRVAAHAADANLSYAGEQEALLRFASKIARARVGSERIKGLNRAAFRYSSLILKQISEKKIAADKIVPATWMLNQCLQTLALTTGLASKTAPVPHDTAKEWIVNKDWGKLSELLASQWSALLKSDPNKLTDDELAI